MKKITRRVGLFAFIFILSTGWAIAGTFSVDKIHSNVGFSVAHKVISSVRGNFTEFEGSLEFDEKTKEITSVMATIKADSIDTDQQKRDAHLRSPDFLDAANHPEITFKSKKVIRQENDQYQVIGDLTIRGVTKEVLLDGKLKGVVKDKYQGKDLIVAGFEAKGKIDRKEFGVNWNKVLDFGGMVVGEEVELLIEVEAVRMLP